MNASDVMNASFVMNVSDVHAPRLGEEIGEHLLRNDDGDLLRECRHTRLRDLHEAIDAAVNMQKGIVEK